MKWNRNYLVAVQRAISCAPEVHRSPHPDDCEVPPRHGHLEVAVMPNGQWRGHLWSLTDTSCCYNSSLKLLDSQCHGDEITQSYCISDWGKEQRLCACRGNSRRDGQPSGCWCKHGQTDRQAAWHCQAPLLLTAVALSAHDSPWAGSHRHTDRRLDRRGKEGQEHWTLVLLFFPLWPMTVNVKTREWRCTCTGADFCNVATRRKTGYWHTMITK